MLCASWNIRLKIFNWSFVLTGREFLFQTLNSNECYCLKFKQDKVQFTAENYVLFCVCVCRMLLVATVAAAGGGGGGDIM